MTNYARIEWERRFLLPALPPALPAVYQRLIDLYLPETRLRLRRIENPSGEIEKYKLAHKVIDPQAPAGHRWLTNLTLNEAEYHQLSLLGGYSLQKRRYRYVYEGILFGIDLFEGELTGLILAEVEQCGPVELGAVPFPLFATQEVTDDPRYWGSALAQCHTWPQKAAGVNKTKTP
jgi:hypothetical protein